MEVRFGLRPPGDFVAARVGAQVKAFSAGRHADGGGLYLHVNSNAHRSWTLIIKAGGRLRAQILGAPARELALEDAEAAERETRTAQGAMANGDR